MIKTKVVAIENSPLLFEKHISLEEFARMIPGARIIVVQVSGNGYVADPILGNKPGKIIKAANPVNFYAKLTEEYCQSDDDRILRIHGANYPLSGVLFAELMSDEFVQYDYVLSNAEECGLSGMFMELFGKQAFRKILSLHFKTTPGGYFNGMALENSKRHFYSEKLHRFYLEEHFEDLFDSPRWLAINIVSRCNYKCAKCQFHSPYIDGQYPPEKRRYGTNMSLDEIKSVLDKTKVYKRLKIITPTLSGEFLTHPDAPEIVRLIHQYGYSISFATNASLLTEDMSRKLLDAKVESIAFSLDAVTQETYSKVQSGNLAEVEANIIRFLDMKKEKNASTACSMIFVVNKNNEHEMEAYRNKWLGKYGLPVAFSAEHDISNHNRPYFLDRRWESAHRVCKALWFGLYMNRDGSPVICCGFARPWLPPLKCNIHDMNADELWRSRSIQAIRKNELKGVKPSLCEEFSCHAALLNTWVGEGERMIQYNFGSRMEILYHEQLNMPTTYNKLPLLIRAMARKLLPSGVKKILKRHILR